MSYDHWRKRLEIAQQHKTVAARRAAVAALKINFSQPAEADCGYYRKPITEKHASGNGQNVITGWVPVSYFMHGDKLVGIIGIGDDARDMTNDEVTSEELWSWVVSNPIPYEWYNGVVEHGDPWPDQPPGKNPAIIEALETAYPSDPEPPLDPIERIVGRTDNKPPEVPPHVEHATAIDNAIAAASDLKVTTEAEANLAAGSKNRIAELRLAADKAGKAEYQPPYTEYKRLHGLWSPPVARAETAEKKITTKILTFRESERKRLAELARQEADRLREEEKANARAADRAIASGESEPPPIVEDRPVVPPPAPISPTYGRTKPREELKKFAVIDDDRKVYEYFRQSSPALIELIQTLATNATRSGLTVPGTTTREGLI